MTRWVEMQTWPAFAYPLCAVAAATLSISASGITIKGELEPSSIVTFLSPAILVIRSPISREPVKVTFAYIRLRHQCVADSSTRTGDALDGHVRDSGFKQDLGQLQCRQTACRKRV